MSDRQVAEVFNADIDANGGYRYSTNARLSSQLATARLTAASFALADFRGQRVLDVGCGDGTYTLEMYDRCAPVSVVGVDLADRAIAAARRRVGHRRITFGVGDACNLPYPDGSFDIAWYLGILHHMDHADMAVREGLRVARRIVVVEPNGYNPVLKVIEKTSRYHIEHQEKSYAPASLNRWVRNAGGEVVRSTFAGLVPMFCPDWMARTLKFVEPTLEATPLLRAVSCAVYVFVAERRGDEDAPRAAA